MNQRKRTAPNNSKLKEGTGDNNIEAIKYSFTLKQILIIGSFVGSTAITIGYAAFSYYKTIDSVKDIKIENDKIRIKIDTLFERSSNLKQELTGLKQSYTEQKK